MSNHQKRISILKNEYKKATERIYPDGHEEAKILITRALQDRIQMLEELECKDYLPSSQRV